MGQRLAPSGGRAAGAGWESPETHRVRNDHAGPCNVGELRPDPTGARCGSRLPMQTLHILIVENDPVNPELETAVDFDRADSSWAMRDEANDGITIAIFGSSCETRPTQFVDTGDESVLTLISEEIMPAGMACFDSQNLWMTAIEIPEGYENFTSVTVDNGASVLV